MTKTPRERARDYRRAHGVEPRAVSDHPGLAARRKKRAGLRLTVDEEEALREYNRVAAAASRAQKGAP